MTVTPSHSRQAGVKKRSYQKRHLARELGLQILFQWDFNGYQCAGSEEFWLKQVPAPEVKQFADQLILGVQEQYKELDELIVRYAQNWTIDRMPVVDRNILRQALYEFLFIPDVPAKVTMDEALHLAKSFADEDTRRFVNGMLDQVLKLDPRLDQKWNALKNEELSNEKLSAGETPSIDHQ